MTDTMSSIGKVPISYFVYSALSFFARHHGGELPGSWFVRALTEAGRDEAAVRQTLYRMERDGELVTRRDGRVKFYRPSNYAAAEIDAGTAKIFSAPAEDWDEEWTWVRIGLRSPAGAVHRERIIALLAVEGFARLDANLFVHPRAAAERLYDALPTQARRSVAIMRGRLANTEAQQSLVDLWPLRRLAQRYRKVIAKLRAIDERFDRELSDRDAFLLRFEVVFTYLGVAWDDPGLPAALLPHNWPAGEAREAAARLYELLLPGAIRFGNALLSDVLRSNPELSRT